MPIEQNRNKAGQDGSERKAHYGDGKQPWDIIVEQGWGPAFAAANVLKYIRRTKNPEHSFESACWYYDQLRVRALDELKVHVTWGRIWGNALTSLIRVLTKEELERIYAAVKAKDGSGDEL